MPGLSSSPISLQAAFTGLSFMACLPLLSWRARRSGNNPSQFVLREVEGSNRPSAADCGWITGDSETEILLAGGNHVVSEHSEESHFSIENQKLRPRPSEGIFETGRMASSAIDARWSAFPTADRGLRNNFETPERLLVGLRRPKLASDWKAPKSPWYWKSRRWPLAPDHRRLHNARFRRMFA